MIVLLMFVAFVLSLVDIHKFGPMTTTFFLIKRILWERNLISRDSSNLVLVEQMRSSREECQSKLDLKIIPLHFSSSYDSTENTTVIFNNKKIKIKCKYEYHPAKNPPRLFVYEEEPGLFNELLFFVKMVL